MALFVFTSFLSVHGIMGAEVSRAEFDLEASEDRLC
jgi:hypothetical protein